ncbi:sulfur carrier protein ThiS adenylyltransferase ThiF [Campylobacter sp. RM15925]|uniref:sulfur carrier protein ThiS adenylyltransferase ThiF n=1 Tax=Campylobacter sp. RM15925 TaxID=1705724 RepID=UPI0014736317|nr:sulfur carrier protein ThiS adenylyltransferase ThiF [Campylobacter sp. RM15925]
MNKMFSRNVAGATDALNELNITICGAGGIGSNLAVMLVRSGVKKLTIIDFDTVELSNLNRQHYFLKDIGKPKVVALKEVLESISQVQIEAIEAKITAENAKEILKNFDVICEAFDSAEQKAMIANFVLANLDSVFIASSGMSGLSGEMKVRKVSEKFYVCGDETSDMKDGIMSPRVNICAGMMANLVLNLALQRAKKERA